MFFLQILLKVNYLESFSDYYKFILFVNNMKCMYFYNSQGYLRYLYEIYTNSIYNGMVKFKIFFTHFCINVQILMIWYFVKMLPSKW